MLLGCIGDDFTGSADLANTLAKGGMRTVQYTSIPQTDAAPDVEAGVISLKTRTCSPDEAVEGALRAAAWLMRQGCRQFFFKYCSTFDSTPAGNIGPVVDALMKMLGTDRALVCPAFPATGRTLYNGHLFVGDRLLSRSGMEAHPLTPMTEPDIRQWLGSQTEHPVGHVPYKVVLGGADAVRLAINDEVNQRRPLVIVDAVSDRDLFEIGAAAASCRLITGASGIAMGLPDNFRRLGLAGTHPSPGRWTSTPGPVAALSGSCSAATRRQIAFHKAAQQPAFQINADDVIEDRCRAQDLAAWFADHHDAVPLAYSSADPALVEQVQRRHGKVVAAGRLEAFLAETAVLLVTEGVTRLVIAGGETSGAVVGALETEVLEIGPEVDPGVPMLKAANGKLALALKSGNFGADDFFIKAAEMMDG